MRMLSRAQLMRERLLEAMDDKDVPVMDSALPPDGMHVAQPERGKQRKGFVLLDMRVLKKGKRGKRRAVSR